MRPAKYLLVPAILCMPIPATFEAASISGVLASKELPLMLLLVVINGTVTGDAAATPRLDKRYDAFLSSGSALDMLLKAGFDMRGVGAQSGGGIGATGAVGADGSGGDRPALLHHDHDVKGIFMAGYFMLSAFFILMVLWYVPDLLVKGSSIYYLWFDPDRLWSIPEDYKQKYYGPYPHVRDLRWYLPNFLMGADPNASIEPFAQITGIPGRMHSDRPMRFSEASHQSDATIASGVSRHDAAFPDRVAPPQPGELHRRHLVASHSHQRSSSAGGAGAGPHVSHVRYPSVGARSQGRRQDPISSRAVRVHRQTGQPILQTPQYTYHTQLQPQQQQIQQILQKPTQYPEAQLQQPQYEQQQDQLPLDGTQPQDEQQLQEEQPLHQSRLQSQDPQEQFITLPANVQVQVSIRRVYMVQLYPRRRVWFGCRPQRTLADRAAAQAVAALGIGTRTGLPSFKRRGSGRSRRGDSGGNRYRLPSEVSYMAPRSPVDYGMEACIEGKALS